VIAGRAGTRSTHRIPHARACARDVSFASRDTGARPCATSLKGPFLMTPLLGRAGLYAAVVGTFLCRHAQAQEQPAEGASSGSPLRVTVLRTTQGEAGAAAEAVDGALLRDLAAVAGIDNPNVSPIDYAEIQLTVGCSDEGRQCLSSIAKTVQVDAVVVRKLTVEPGRATLTLAYLDATAADEPAHAEHVAEGAAAIEALASAVPALVRRLFGIPESVVAAAPEQQPGAAAPADEASYSDEPLEPEPGGGSVGPLTWVALGVGAVALGAGVVLGLSAQSSFEDYKQTEEIDTIEGRAEAEQHFDSAESKGQIATVLIPAGAVVLALGATLLVIDLSDDGGAGSELGLAPLPGGALLSLRTALEGP
jgi:hypothetical protein